MSFSSTIHAIINYQEFFGKETPESEFLLLNKYPTDLIVFHAAKINAILFKKEADVLNCQKSVLKLCFPKLNYYRKKLIVAQIKRYQFENDVPLFFASPAIVKLINLAFKNFLPLGDDYQINEEQFQGDLFDSILISNLYYKELGISERLDTYENIWYLQLMQQYYIRDHQELLFIAPIKYLFLFKYLNETFKDGKKYLQEFNGAFHCQGFFNYISFFFKIFSDAIVENKNSLEPKIFLNVDEIGAKMIEAFSLRPEYFIRGKYIGKIHQELIPRPIYYVDNDHPLILDYHFFLYVIDISLHYNFYRYTSLNSSPLFPKFENFKSYLGKNYYEDYLLKNILSKIFNRKNFKIYTDQDKERFLDFIVVNNKDIFLIEVKSNSINANVFEEINIGQLKEFLEQNFLQQKNSFTNRNKGVFQIIRFMNDLCFKNTHDKLLNDVNLKRKLNIYPIIVYTDKVLDMHGINNYLNDKYDTEISKTGLSFRHIHPLTTINYTFFIKYYSQLKKNPSLLKGLIHDYWRKVKNRKKTFKRDQHPKSFLNSNISFDSFASDTLGSKTYSNFFTELVNDCKLKETEN